MEPLHHDAQSASAAERAGPGAVWAHRLVQRAAALTPAGWEEVTRRARALDPAAHPAAVRRLWHALIGHLQSRALDAINRSPA